MKDRVRWVPLVAFILLGAALTYGLAKPDNNNITSKMVGASVPSFALAPATSGVPGLSSADLAAGRPHLVNIFASWCVPCIAEAPQLKAIADAGVPESFVVDGKGNIRQQTIGPINPQDVAGVIAAVKEAQ